ncbi:hypothetical protein TNCV_1282561 [Trichonephila clavipes]|uniref:Uncharacterized protein n=1 Tax=Trichonephila clavipes TaxID=2585209 RepID=A0A8X6VP01_TRICX|nr:hypothetical protein TNCV_1282561 [Trichonephila clavipes]
MSATPESRFVFGCTTVIPIFYAAVSRKAIYSGRRAAVRAAPDVVELCSRGHFVTGLYRVLSINALAESLGS